MCGDALQLLWAELSVGEEVRLIKKAGDWV
jgi:hypothetical protein